MNFKNIFIKIFLLGWLSIFLNQHAFSNSYEYAIMGDAGKWNSDVRSVYHSLLRQNVKKLIMPGDNLYSSTFSSKTYDDVWFSWKLANFDFFAVAIGNHNDGYANEVKFFKMPAEYYSVVDHELVKFIVLNSDNENTVYEQAAFLEYELATSVTPFNFIVYHHPSYTVSYLHWYTEKERFQDAIRPILKKYRDRITALLIGHDHVSLIAHFGDLPAILSGSTHEQRPHFPFNYTTDGTKVETSWFNAKFPLWAKLTIDENSLDAKIDFVRSSNDTNICSVTIKTGERAKFWQCLHVDAIEDE